jgi:peptidyl-prolyl cis-trans isomerase C
MARVLRAPAVHFVLLGACLAVAVRLAGPRPAPAPGVTDDELLYRAAVALGVDRNDRAVHERLTRLATFVGEDASSEAALEAEARQLGLARSDVVVKRHLALVMRLAAGRLAPEDVPTDDDLRAYFAAHADEFATPPRVRFTQVYVSRAHHPDDLEARAQQVLATLRAGATSPEGAPALGDAFVTGAEVGPATAADVDRRFGPGFAAELAAVEPHTWGGPFRSSYGLHLVCIDERLPAATPSFEAVRGRVTHRLLHAREMARTQQRLAALRAR